MDLLLNNEVFNVATAVVAAAAAVANVTKTEKDNKVVGWISGLINFLALRWKK